MTATQVVAEPLRCGSPCSPDRKGLHPQTYIAKFSGVLQADTYAGFSELYR
ncbi:transposase [Pantoea sp. BJ2]|uniref:IS66 family transposase n=1 Tax=Pantoea sp. BJ2 TaxID=3141322 RepID=UPI003305A5E3